MLKCIFGAKKSRVVFTIRLADTPIEVRALYRQTKKFCRDYLTDEPAKMSVSIENADIREDRRLAAQQMKREGRRCFYYFKRYYEPTALCRKIMSELIAHDILLFHGAVMAVEGNAYLFTAKSGTGKTTHCRLWLKNIPDCHILNGDKPLLMFGDGKVCVCGSPWQGKENYGVNEILPLKGICILSRDKTNHIEEITLKDGFETLMNQCHIPEGNGDFVKAVNMVKQLSNVKLYRLGCNMEEEAANVAYHTMKDSR